MTFTNALAHPGGLPLFRLANGDKHWEAVLLSLESE